MQVTHTPSLNQTKERVKKTMNSYLHKFMSPSRETNHIKGHPKTSFEVQWRIIPVKYFKKTSPETHDERT